MIDGHIHLNGEYTLKNIDEIVKKAMQMNLKEIWLLDHSYLFIEFFPMYREVMENNEFNKNWITNKKNNCSLSDYDNLIKEVRIRKYPIKIKFGIEICYFKKYEQLVKDITSKYDFDFLIGSVHFVNDFAFGRGKEEFSNYNIDKLYKTYFETSIDLANSKIFDVIAHPDSIKLFGYIPKIDLKPYYEELIKSVLNADMYIEQNSGVSRNYKKDLIGMEKELLELALRSKAKIMTSSDAHKINDIGDKIKEINEELKQYKERG